MSYAACSQGFLQGEDRAMTASCTEESARGERETGTRSNGRAPLKRKAMTRHFVSVLRLKCLVKSVGRTED